MENSLILNVKVVLLNKGRVLLLERDGKWTIPGGKYEAQDNSIDDIIEREIEEETAITDIEIGDILHALINKSGGRILLFYKATTAITEVTLDEDHPNYQWVKLDKIDQIDFEYPELLRIINLAH